MIVNAAADATMSRTPVLNVLTRSLGCTHARDVVRPFAMTVWKEYTVMIAGERIAMTVRVLWIVSWLPNNEMYFGIHFI
jgi:hypothetical protein